MIYEYKKIFEVGYSDVDCTLRLNTVCASQYLQELATGIFVKLGVDYETMAAKYHSGWVLMRAKFHFQEMPHLGEQVVATVYPTRQAATYMRFEARFERPDGSPLFLAIMETCLIDITERSIVNVKQIAFPADIEYAAEQSNLKIERMNVELEEAAYTYEQKIYASDIDYNRHVNNIHYVRYMLNALPCSFWEKARIREIEIKYLRECVEGQTLRIYQQQNMQDGLRFEIKESGQSIVRAHITLDE